MAEIALIAAAGQAISTVMDAQAIRAQGEAQQAAKNLEAQQMRQSALSEQASAQRRALEARRQNRLAQSRALAVGGASGFSVDDSGFTQGIADLEGEGEYAFLTSLYEGDRRAQDLRYGASVSEVEGRNAKRESKRKATSTLISGLSKAAGTASGYGGWGSGAENMSGQSSSLSPISGGVARKPPTPTRYR